MNHAQVAPAGSGLTQAGCARIEQLMQDYVSSGKSAGMLTLVYRQIAGSIPDNS